MCTDLCCCAQWGPRALRGHTAHHPPWKVAQGLELSWEGTESFGPASLRTGMEVVPARHPGAVLGAAAVLPFEHLAWQGCRKEAQDQP